MLTGYLRGWGDAIDTWKFVRLWRCYDLLEVRVKIAMLSLYRASLLRHSGFGAPDGRTPSGSYLAGLCFAPNRGGSTKGATPSALPQCLPF